MLLNVPTIVVIYLLIGLFFAGLYLAFDDGVAAFFLILFFWPTIFLIIACIIAIVAPVVIGRFIGDRIKNWF